MNGFVSFPSMAERDEFVDAVLNTRPELKDHFVVVSSRPDVVMQGITADQRDTLQRSLPGSGAWFDDVQFGAMGG